MAFYAPLRKVVTPSFTLPGLLAQRTLRSGFRHLLSDAIPQPRLGPNDLMVYANTIRVSTMATAAQSFYTKMAANDIRVGYIGCSTMKIRLRNQYTDEDSSGAGEYDLPLQNAFENGMRQASAQLIEDMCLIGDGNGGFLFTPGVEHFPLPAAPVSDVVNLNDYGANYLFNFGKKITVKLVRRLQLIESNAKANANGEKVKVVWLMSQQALSALGDGTVNFTANAAPGMGTESPIQAITRNMEAMNIDVQFMPSNKLSKMAAGGKDAIIVTVPELPEGSMPEEELNTNYFQDHFSPQIKANNAMFCDVLTPVIKTMPIDASVTYDMVGKHRMSYGWLMRPEATLIVDCPPMSTGW